MASSYFSEPEDHLDPALFDGMKLRPGIREHLLEFLYSGLEDIGLRAPEDWVYAWLAGSGVSYQWSADRGNGDLDVLFGVDYPRFLSLNPAFPRLGKAEVAKYVDKMLKELLWTKTAHYSINGKTFEVTFFWNPDTDNSIRMIHPYAAYSLTMNKWDVPPNPSPQHDFPESWKAYADFDSQEVSRLDKVISGGSVHRESAVQMARGIWEDIHGGRKFAFTHMGSGYSDFHNYRWQAGKQSGTVDILRKILADNPEPSDSIPQPDDIITRAALRYAGPHYSEYTRG